MFFAKFRGLLFLGVAVCAGSAFADEVTRVDAGQDLKLKVELPFELRGEELGGTVILSSENDSIKFDVLRIENSVLEVESLVPELQPAGVYMLTRIDVAFNGGAGGYLALDVPEGSDTFKGTTLKAPLIKIINNGQQDTTAPIISSVTLKKNIDSLEFTIKASDDLSGLDEADMYISNVIDSEEVIGNIEQYDEETPGIYKFVFKGVSSGTYIIDQITVYDKIGNSAMLLDDDVSKFLPRQIIVE